FADVGGDIAHDNRLRRAEGLLPADSQYGHGESRALEDPVVLDVLRKRGELSKPGAHGAGFGVLRRVIRACGLVRPARIARECIPDAVQIDALAPADETLG